MTKDIAELDLKINKMNFEEAYLELEQIVRRLETGKENLDKALLYYEYANKLKNRCQELLKQAELKVQKLMQNEDGSVSLNEMKFGESGQ